MTFLENHIHVLSLLTFMVVFAAYVEKTPLNSRNLERLAKRVIKAHYCPKA